MNHSSLAVSQNTFQFVQLQTSHQLQPGLTKQFVQSQEITHESHLSVVFLNKFWVHNNTLLVWNCLHEILHLVGLLGEMKSCIFKRSHCSILEQTKMNDKVTRMTNQHPN